MNQINILSFLGILFGWFLSELSRHFRDRTEDNKLISELITKLLAIRFELYQYNSFAKYILNSNDETETELRQKIIERSYFKAGTIGKELSELCKDLSAYDPILAFEFSSKVLKPQNLNELKFDNTKEFKALMAMTTTVNKLTIKKLENLILKLGLKKGLILWLRLKLHLKKEKFKYLDNIEKTQKIITDYVDTVLNQD